MNVHLYFPHLFSGFEKIVRLLIDKGVNVNALNKANNSALIFAIANGKFIKQTCSFEAFWISTFNFRFKPNEFNSNSYAQDMWIMCGCSWKMEQILMLSTRLATNQHWHRRLVQVKLTLNRFQYFLFLLFSSKYLDFILSQTRSILQRYRTNQWI